MPPRELYRTDDFLPGVARVALPLDRYLLDARDCDVALWEPRSLSGRFIAAATQGPFCHASAIICQQGSLWSVGYEEGNHGSISPLAAAVRRWPDRISIFRCTELRAATRDVKWRLLADLDGDYDWSTIRLIVVGHALVFRLLTWMPCYRRLALRHSRSTSSAICSQHVARAFRRGAGLQLVRVVDALVTPNDLGRSPLLEYQGTLVPAVSPAEAPPA